MVSEEVSNQPININSDPMTIYKLLASAVERVSDGFVVLDTDWRYVYVNKQAAQMLNREKPEDLIGKHIWTEYPEGVGQPFYHAYHKAVETQEMVHLEEYYEPWDRWFENRIYPSPDGLTIYFTEITERKRAERALHEAEERLRLAVKAANIGLWDWDLRTNRVYYSPEWKKQIGYEDHEIANDFSEWQSHVHPEDLEIALRTVQEFIAHPYPNYQNEFRFRHRDGTYRWILAQADLLYNEQGEPIRMLGSHVDITERKQIEESLRESEQQLRNILNSMFPFVGLLTSQGVLIEANRPPLDIAGLQREEVLGKPLEETYWLSYSVKIQEQIRRSIQRVAQGEIVRYDMPIRVGDGQFITIDFMLHPIYDSSGQVVQMVASGVDITQRKQVDNALRESEERLRLFIEYAPASLAMFDREMRYLAVSHRWLMDYNLGERDILGLSHYEIFPEISDYWKAVHQRGLAGEVVKVDEDEFVRADGNLQWLRWEVRPWYRSEGVVGGIVIFTEDITERRRAEDAVYRLNKRLMILHEIDRDIIASRSSEAIVNVVLQGIRQLIVCERASLVLFNEGTSEVIIFSTDNADESAIQTNMRVPLTPNVRLDLLRSGQVLMIPDLQKLDDPTSELAKQAVAEGIRSTITAPLLMEGQLLGHLSMASKTPGFFTAEHKEIIQEKANLLAIALHQANLRAQIKQQNIQLEQRVAERTAQLEAKNREMGTFTYSVSHDLKAPLRGIDGYSRLLLEDYIDRLDEQGRSFLTNIRTAADQMNQLINDLLAYSRLEQRSLQIDQINPHKLIQSLVAERSAEIKAREADVILSVPDTTVTADPNGLAMALRNLLDNALKFTRQAEKTIIEIGGDLTDTSCILWVRDNGIGFDMKYHDRIFEIFQRLHRVEDHPGTGIGLAIVQKAMQRIGGRVWAESEPGKGTIFYLEVPK